jgi:hypothetical protein
LLCDVGSIHGFFPDLASHHDRLGFHSCVRDPPANDETGFSYSFSPIAWRKVAGQGREVSFRDAMVDSSHSSARSRASGKGTGGETRQTAEAYTTIVTWLFPHLRQ